MERQEIEQAGSSAAARNGDRASAKGRKKASQGQRSANIVGITYRQLDDRAAPTRCARR